MCKEIDGRDDTLGIETGRGKEIHQITLEEYIKEFRWDHTKL